MLHILEVATIFGAAQAHLRRGFSEPICINSFPSETLAKEEVEEFNRHYGHRIGCAIIEILEYPAIAMEIWEEKRKNVKDAKLKIALDDYGNGINDSAAIDFFKPELIKLDRLLISNIDQNPDQQERIKQLIQDFHRRGIEVLGEGIETQGELECLVCLGVDYLQGYYLGMPG